MPENSPSDFSGDKQDPLLKRAADLVSFAEVNAIGMFTPLLERFPFLRQVDTEQWDFFLTVAYVFMASYRLTDLHLGDTREGKLMEVVTEHLSRWKPDGIRGFENCKELFYRECDSLAAAGHENRFVASDAVGLWIVWNILGRQPKTDEERMLVRTTGVMVTHTFTFDWWVTETDRTG
jgi:hypothetical protein